MSEPAAAPSPEPAGTAWSLADEGRLGDALKWCDEAICNDKFNARLHYLRSTILEEMSELEQAIASLKHAIYLEERFVMAEFRLANLSKRVGRDGDARKFAANAIGLLETYDKNAVPENCEGMTAGRLAELIRPLLGVLESAKR